MSCWQCEMDIAHVCYHGIPNTRWGWTDEAVAALEGAQRQGFMLSEQRRNRRAPKKKRRTSR